MATIRTGSAVALVVVDVQVGVVAAAWERDRIVQNVATAVRRARDAGVPVIWVQHSDDDLPRDSAQWQWVQELTPLSSEVRIYKHFNSAFDETDLEAMLNELGVSHLVLAGAATNWCIRATAYGAIERGYDLTLVMDAHTTESMQPEDGRRIEAKDIIDELNIAIRWLTYPGRKNGVATAADFSFSTTGGAIQG